MESTNERRGLRVGLHTRGLAASAIACIVLVLAASCDEGPGGECPDGPVGKIRHRVAGHYQKQATDTIANAMAKAGLDYLEQARIACLEGPAKDCPEATCREQQPKLECKIQPVKSGSAEAPNTLKDLNVGDDYYALPVAKRDEAGEWFFECECNCVP